MKTKKLAILESPPKNIIVRMPNWLGDCVMATPILADLRKQCKGAKITVMCQSNVASLLQHNPNINEIYSYKRPSGWIHRKQHIDIYKTLSHGEYDLGILLTNSFSSAWWFYRGNVRNRIGYTGNLRNFFLDHAIPTPKMIDTQHLVVTYKMLLAPLGIAISETPPRLYISSSELEEAKKRLAKHTMEVGKHILVGINPGAAYGSAKCWLPERFNDVTKKLLEDPNVFIAYFGDATGAPLVNNICKDMPSRVMNFAGKTNLRELLALVKCCSIFLTNDSGPMHIADAMGIPILALFGSTSDVKTGPYHKGEVIHKHVECSPCYKRVCPIDFRCMKQIGVEEVYQKLKNILDQQS